MSSFDLSPVKRETVKRELTVKREFVIKQYKPT